MNRAYTFKLNESSDNTILWRLEQNRIDNTMIPGTDAAGGDNIGDALKGSGNEGEAETEQQGTGNGDNAGNEQPTVGITLPNEIIDDNTEENSSESTTETTIVSVEEPIHDNTDQIKRLHSIILVLSLVCLLLCVAIAALLRNLRKVKDLSGKKKESATKMNEKETDTLPELSIGKIHNIGKRASQQDNLGYMNVDKGVFAVVADGMGGLTESDLVSQNVVQSLIGSCRNLNAEQIRNNLPALISRANNEVNRILGPNGIYKSGSTAVCVFAEPDQLRWISVGDSRVYLYRSGTLLQLNREHIYETELILQSVNGKGSFRAARENRQRKHLTSFIGMGEIKYIDFNLNPVEVKRGDRIILTTDGVFNTLSDSEIAAIIDGSSDANAVTAALEKAVLEKASPYQDNFSMVLICYN